MTSTSPVLAKPIRLMVDAPAEGAWNMGIDEALLNAVAVGSSPDTLRFYQWKEPTLSLGYFQSLGERAEHLASRDCPVVRRSSGGGAILHDQELTYSLAIKAANRFGTRELYDLVHRSLIRVLGEWSIRAELFSPIGEVSATREPFLCFQRRARGDVVCEGAKICGSAQRRLGPVVLQHGSVLLKRSRCAPELPGLADLGARELDAAELVEAWKTELQRQFERPFVAVPGWDTVETEAAEAWRRERFTDQTWLERR